MTAATSWTRSPTDSRLTCSPVGLRLIDDLTGASPLGEITCILFIEDPPGQYRPTDLRAVRGAGGLLVFPGLGRSRETSAAPRRYRAAISATFYRPFYAAQQDGIDFTAPPFNDDQPPAQPVGVPQDVVLVPSTAYPFPPYLRVLRGVVRDAGGTAAVNAEVSRGNAERVLSDERGCYALPLRHDPNNVAISIDAIDHRSGRQGQIQVTLPDDLGTNQPIIVN
jgi:hypothetical protein